MRLLALDTSSPVCSVAFWDTALPEVLYQVESTAELQHGRFILPLIEQVLKSGSCTINALDGIVYSRGPGALTGIRLACAVAQGLGVAAGCPIIPISSLAVLAETARWVHGETHCLVATDAHSDAIYWGAFNVQQSGELILQESERRVALQALPAISPDLPWCGVGGGWEKYGDRLTSGLGFVPTRLYTSLLPKISVLLTLGQRAHDRGEGVQAADAVPTYLS
jgi:tRNA threonylcarbamoyladenosine biosynthesis protein TsaB